MLQYLYLHFSHRFKKKTEHLLFLQIWSTTYPGVALWPLNCRIPQFWPMVYAGFRLAWHSPLCRYAARSSLAVSELQLSAATPLWLYHWAASLPSWIEFNCLQSAAVGKAVGLSIDWQDAAYRLVFPLLQVALAQLFKNHHQSGNAANGRLVWKQHYSAVYGGYRSGVSFLLELWFHICEAIWKPATL